MNPCHHWFDFKRKTPNWQVLNSSWQWLKNSDWLHIRRLPMWPVKISRRWLIELGHCARWDLTSTSGSTIIELGHSRCYSAPLWDSTWCVVSNCFRVCWWPPTTSWTYLVNNKDTGSRDHSPTSSFANVSRGHFCDWALAVRKWFVKDLTFCTKLSLGGS